MSHSHPCPCSEYCFLQKAMNTIGGKWKLPILCSLTANGTTRYNDLLRNIKGISNTMLSKSLRELEVANLVKRFEYLEIPVRVEYSLTEKAVRLQPILLNLIQWQMGKDAEEDGGEGERESTKTALPFRKRRMVELLFVGDVLGNVLQLAVKRRT